MAFDYDRSELLMSLTGSISEFFFRGVTDETKAVELRERSRAMGLAIGRIQAVIMEPSEVSPDIYDEIKRLEKLIGDSVADGMSRQIQPGSELWKTLQGKADGD